MKILHGMSNVAGQASYAVKGLRAIGEDARLVVWRDNKLGYEVDKSLGVGKKKWLYPWYVIKMFAYGFYSIFHYDCFHFHYGYSVLPFGLDLPLLKLLKKKYVMEFHGSEIRGILLTEEEKRNLLLPVPPIKKWKLKNIRKIFKYVDNIVLHDAELYRHLVGYNKAVTYVPLRVNVSRFNPIYPDKNCKKPVIVHAPTNVEIKGSKYVMEAVEKLKKKYDLEFIMVQNKTQEEAFEIYQKADIIVDQLRIGTYGVFAIEAMAMGKPVICYVTDEMREQFPEELPIINADVHTIESRLEELLQDGEARYNIGVAGRKYVEYYHDYKKIAGLLQQIYTKQYQGGSQRDAFRLVKELAKKDEIN